MSKSKKLMEELVDVAMSPILNIDSITNSFKRKIEDSGIDNLFVDEVDIGDDGDITVTLADSDGNYYVLVFINDDDGTQVLVASDDDSDNDEDSEIVIQLDFLTPPLVNTILGMYVNLSDLSWLDKDTLINILKIAGLPIDLVVEPTPNQDEFGNIITTEELQQLKECKIEELYKIVVRGGKKQKIKLVRRSIKRRMTSKQRMAARRGALKRKRKMVQSARKRKRSLSIRKRQHIRTPTMPKSKYGYKVG